MLAPDCSGCCVTPIESPHLSGPVEGMSATSNAQRAGSQPGVPHSSLNPGSEMKTGIYHKAEPGEEAAQHFTHLWSPVKWVMQSGDPVSLKAHDRGFPEVIRKVWRNLFIEAWLERALSGVQSWGFQHLLCHSFPVLPQAGVFPSLGSAPPLQIISKVLEKKNNNNLDTG